MQDDYAELKKQNQAQAIELPELKKTIVEFQLNLKHRNEKIVSLEEEKAGLEGQLKQMQTMLPSNKIRVAG